MARLPPRRVGAYRLTERLGEGSTAEVWKIESAGPAGFSRVRVAKRLLPERAADAGFVEMLVDEAKLSARLDHANLVRVFDLEHVDGEYLLTMEHVDGCDLRSLLVAQAKLGAPPIGFALYVAREICRGLAHAHALADEQGRPLGIVHRDVSPSNILVGKNGSVKLTDFGVAHARSRAASGAIEGNLAYMAPEQLAGAPTDRRADLYALGVVLHECLTAKRLWKGAYDVEGMRLLRARPPLAPSVLSPAVPQRLDDICARAMADHPAQRYADAGELGAALDPLLAETGFDAAALSALVRTLGLDARRDPSDEPGRRTLTHAPRTRSRAPLLLVPVAAIAVALSLHRTPAVAPAVVIETVPVVAPPPAAIVVPPVAAAPPKPRAHRSPQRPDLVHGTLVDPFRN